ncbi:DUF3278 domain-containing protein [Streptococcus entericus]
MMNLNKDNLYIFFLRRFYDITSDLDEYTISEINKFGNNMYMLMYGLVFLIGLAYFFNLPGAIEVIILILLFLPPHLQKKMARRLGLDKIEIDKQGLKQAKLKMLRRTLLQTTFTAIGLGWLFLFANATHDYRPDFLSSIALPVWATVVVSRLAYLAFKNNRKITIID